MILKTLYLKIGDLELPTEYTYEFLKGSRYICNYIEREVLADIQFEAEGFNRISIALCSNPTREFFLNSSKVACCDIIFDREQYDNLAEKDLPGFYIKKIKEGLNQVKKFSRIPDAEIFQGLGDFEAGGLVNKWIYKEKVFKKQSLKASLSCELTRTAFRLTLEILKDDLVQFSEIILETDPDENAFEYRYKDLKVENGVLVVTSKTGDRLFHIDIGELKAASTR